MDHDEMRGAMKRATDDTVRIHSDPEGRWVLWQADCRTILSRLPDNCVDAIVTDPPYELTANKKGGSGIASQDLSTPYGRARITAGGGFMGKEWDATGIAHDVSFWREALRVLKPGGHLLAFGGSRTYHRLACAVEDAGFEIRDQIQWVYASGFPKSLNVSKSDKVCQCDVEWVYGSGSQGTESETEHHVRFVPDGDLSQAINAESQRGEVLFSGVSEQDSPRHGATRAESENAGKEQPGMEGRRDHETSEGQLQGGQVRQVPRGVSANGKKGRLHHGTPPSDGAHGRQISDAHRGGEPHKSQPIGQQARELGVVPNERGSQTWRGWSICGRCGKPQIANGLGSALKPAHEPIVVARKPLEGTVAANVLKWGTGALNIDGTRVDMGDEYDPTKIQRQQNSAGAIDGAFGASALIGKEIHTYKPGGRWPANFIHDGSDEVLALFPDTAPAKRGERQPRGKIGTPTFGDYQGMPGRISGYEDMGGSAARFFYCAKASKAERNAGLGHLEPQKRYKAGGVGGTGGRRSVSDAVNAPPQSNHHPTVKPIALMRYLIRLVTPPGGIVLDPFAGSGTTMVAALMEGAQPWGCEMTEEYVPIIVGRVTHTIAEIDATLDGRL